MTTILNRALTDWLEASCTGKQIVIKELAIVDQGGLTPGESIPIQECWQLLNLVAQQDVNLLAASFKRSELCFIADRCDQVTSLVGPQDQITSAYSKNYELMATGRKRTALLATLGVAEVTITWDDRESVLEGPSSDDLFILPKTVKKLHIFVKTRSDSCVDAITALLELNTRLRVLQLEGLPTVSPEKEARLKSAITAMSGLRELILENCFHAQTLTN